MPSLKKHLAEVLPHYMVPSQWMVLERMPRNGNDKTDRAGLKEQFRRLASAATQFEQDAKETAHVA